MAFDRTNQQDLDWLHTEVFTDPISMGYVPGSTQQGVLARLNDPALNVGGETTGSDLTPRLLLDAIDPADLTPSGNFTQGELEFLKLVVESSASIDDNIEPWRAKITGMFQAQAATRQALEAQSRALSRAEVMFGADTQIGTQDWFEARDNGNIVPVVW